MLEVGRVFIGKRSGAMLQIQALPTSTCGKLVLRRLLRTGMGFVLPHVHVGYDETFKIEEGVADAWVGRRRLRLGQGEEFVVTRLTTHVNPYNRSMRDLVFTQTLDAGDDGVRYAQTLARHLEDGRDVRGDLPPLAALALLKARHPETYAPGLSRNLQRRVVFPLARSAQEWRDERRIVKEELAATDAASEYGYWAETTSSRAAGLRRFRRRPVSR